MKDFAKVPKGDFGSYFCAKKSKARVRYYALDFFLVSKSKNNNPGIANKVERIKNSYQPKTSANTPALEVRRLRENVANETNKAY